MAYRCIKGFGWCDACGYCGEYSVDDEEPDEEYDPDDDLDEE